MRQAVRIWDWWKEDPPNLEELRKHFLWLKDEHGRQVVIFDSHPENTSDDARVTRFITFENSVDGRWQLLGNKNVHRAAECYLLLEIEKYRGRRSTLVWDAQNKRLTQVVMPRSLLEALWSQFEHFVIGDCNLIKCPGCDRWFEVSGEVSRTDMEYCEAKCRSRANRRHIASAKKMRAEGKSIAEIAQHIEIKKIPTWFAKEMRAEGKSIAEIAQKLDLKTEKVSELFAKEMRTEGKSIAEIAQELDLETKEVRECFRKRKEKKRDGTKKKGEG